MPTSDTDVHLTFMRLMRMICPRDLISSHSPSSEDEERLVSTAINPSRTMTVSCTRLAPRRHPTAPRVSPYIIRALCDRNKSPATALSIALIHFLIHFPRHLCARARVCVIFHTLLYGLLFLYSTRAHRGFYTVRLYALEANNVLVKNTTYFGALINYF